MCKFIYSSLIVLGLFSCSTTDKKVEQELPKTEETTKIKEEPTEEPQSDTTTENAEAVIVDDQIPELDIERNLAQGENDKFTVRVDRLTDNSLIYRSWSKPKVTTEKPDLTLEYGMIEKLGSGGGYHYIFSNGKWEYIIENNLMGENEEDMGLFLKLLRYGEQKIYTKLKDITIDDSEKESYSTSDLIGRWWTPHFAVRKIEFFENEKFILNDGNDNVSNGIYTFDNRTVTLTFDSKEDKIVMKLGGGNNDYSYTLVGDGENFVNERD